MGVRGDMDGWNGAGWGWDGIGMEWDVTEWDGDVDVIEIGMRMEVGWNGTDRAWLFTVGPGNRTRGTGRKLMPRKFHLDRRKNFHPVQ